MSKTDPNPKNANASNPNSPQPAKAEQAAAAGKSGTPPKGQGGSVWMLAFLALIVAVAGVTAVIMRSTQSPAPVASASEDMEDTDLERDSALAEESDESEEPEAGEEAVTEEPTTPVRRAPATGTLVVRSDVEGADVLLNGKRVGTTPHQAGGLEPGSYDVRVEKNGFAPYHEKVQLAAKRHEITANLTPAAPRLEVATNVSGATVFIDGEEKGTTPLALEDLPPGRHELRVSAAGYRTYTESLELTGGTKEVSVVLVSPLEGLNEAVAVKHKHRLGSCEGVLRATSSGIVYESDHKDAFTVDLAQVSALELNGNDLGLKVEGGRNYNFAERNDNPDALEGFFDRVHDAVDVSRAAQ